MRPVGFSTGALARGDVSRGVEMIAKNALHVIELSALRQNELQPVVEMLDNLDLTPFDYISFHAPSSIEPAFEAIALELLDRIHARGWPIVVHPDAMHTVQEWNRFGELLCIENMDKRKPVGQTAEDLGRIFADLPQASFCLDLGHARQIDPTMSEAALILTHLGKKLKQVHISEVNYESKHDSLTLEAIMAFQRVSSFIAENIPVILESRVEERSIRMEVESARYALNPLNALALAGD